MPGIFSKSSSQSDLSGRLIDNGRLKLIHVLGRGGFGVVYLALDTHSSTNQYYAVKCLLKDNRPAIQSQSLEVNLHTQLSGKPHILIIHCVIEDSDFLYVVLDLCAGGDLCRGIMARRPYYMDDHKTKTVILQIIDALSACHNAGIFHRDVKPENFLCGSDGLDIRLADFGLATDCSSMPVAGAGSSGYLAPECMAEFVGELYSPRESDLWALGVLIYNLITGDKPWDCASESDPCFAYFLRHPNFLLHNTPISLGAHQILKQIFTSPFARIKLPQLRAEIVKLDTFYRTDKEVSFPLRALCKVVPNDQSYASSDSFETHSRSTNNTVYGVLDDLPSLRSGSCSVDSDGPITPETHPVDPQIEIPVFDDGGMRLDSYVVIESKETSSRFMSVVHRIKAASVNARNRCMRL